MKTFDDFKNELAVECGYKDFSDRLIKGGFSGLPFLYDEAAERYANYKAEIAHDNACNECIDAICDEVVGISKRYAIAYIESILKKNPYKK